MFTGGQFNRHYELWARNWVWNKAKFWVKFSTTSLNMSQNSKNDLGKVLGLILGQEKCLLNWPPGVRWLALLSRASPSSIALSDTPWNSMSGLEQGVCQPVCLCGIPCSQEQSLRFGGFNVFDSAPFWNVICRLCVLWSSRGRNKGHNP